MTLRIERVQGGIRLSGEFRTGHLDQVKTEIERCQSPVVLDLEELDLIDLEGVRFLNACEENGVSILHCSPYIREWMLQERGRPKEPSRTLVAGLMSHERGSANKSRCAVRKK
jgi:hypothetical protein